MQYLEYFLDLQVWFQNRRMKDKRQKMAVAWPYGMVDPNVYAYIMNAAASMAQPPASLPGVPPMAAAALPGAALPGAAHPNPYAAMGLYGAAAGHLPAGLSEMMARAGPMVNPLAAHPGMPHAVPAMPHPAFLRGHLPTTGSPPHLPVHPVSPPSHIPPVHKVSPPPHQPSSHKMSPLSHSSPVRSEPCTSSPYTSHMTSHAPASSPHLPSAITSVKKSPPTSLFRPFSVVSE